MGHGHTYMWGCCEVKMRHACDSGQDMVAESLLHLTEVQKAMVTVWLPGGLQVHIAGSWWHLVLGCSEGLWFPGCYHGEQLRLLLHTTPFCRHFSRFQACGAKRTFFQRTEHIYHEARSKIKLTQECAPEERLLGGSRKSPHSPE